MVGTVITVQNPTLRRKCTGLKTMADCMRTDGEDTRVHVHVVQYNKSECPNRNIIQGCAHFILGVANISAYNTN